ncbi:hypothetical protein [Methylobacterium sp. J-072]|uniref:hypothetical protein n=1 Tax=Methylobacterium sp. J-072 TaxID=2836651 RepID=UPI003919FF35
MPSEGSESEITARAGDGIAVDTRIACLRFKPPDDPDALGPAWRDHHAPIFEVRFRPETDLSVPIAMRSYHLGEMIVGDVVAPAHILERSEETIRRQGIDHIRLQFYQRGQSLVETDRSTRLVTEVQCIVFDLAQPVASSRMPSMRPTC